MSKLYALGILINKSFHLINGPKRPLPFVIGLDEIKKIILTQEPKAFDKKAPAKKKAVATKKAISKKK